MFLSLKENKDFTKEIVDYIFINQNNFTMTSLNAYVSQ